MERSQTPNPIRRSKRSHSEIAPQRPLVRRTSRSKSQQPSTNVFINYIPSDYTEQDLTNLCAQFGTIVTSKLMINLETGQSKCFGFVRFANLNEAQNCINAINGICIGSKRLLAKYAESKDREEKIAQTVYVKRLPVEINPEQVRLLFGTFGAVESLDAHSLDSPDSLYWRCFIRYSDVHAAATAVGQMNNKIIVDGTRPIHVKFADESRLGTVSTLPEAPPVQESLLLPSFLLV